MTAIQSATPFLPLSGGTVTGNVTVSGTITPQSGIAGLWSPFDYGLIAWNYDPAMALGASNSPANGTVQATRIKVPAGLISNLWVGINAAGSSLTAAQNFAGLYSGDGTTLLSATADQSTAWASGFNATSMALVTPQTVAAGYVYVAWYSNASVSTPKFQWAGSANLGNMGLATGVARFATGGTGRTTSLPASLTLAKTADAYWAGVS